MRKKGMWIHDEPSVNVPAAANEESEENSIDDQHAANDTSIIKEQQTPPGLGYDNLPDCSTTPFLVTYAKNLTLIDATRENSHWWRVAI